MKIAAHIVVLGLVIGLTQSTAKAATSIRVDAGSLVEVVLAKRESFKVLKLHNPSGEVLNGTSCHFSEPEILKCYFERRDGDEEGVLELKIDPKEVKFHQAQAQSTIILSGVIAAPVIEFYLADRFGVHQLDSNITRTLITNAKQFPGLKFDKAEEYRFAGSHCESLAHPKNAEQEILHCTYFDGGFKRLQLELSVPKDSVNLLISDVAMSRVEGPFLKRLVAAQELFDLVIDIIVRRSDELFVSL